MFLMARNSSCTMTSGVRLRGCVIGAMGVFGSDAFDGAVGVHDESFKDRPEL